MSKVVIEWDKSHWGPWRHSAEWSVSKVQLLTTNIYQTWLDQKDLVLKNIKNLTELLPQVDCIMPPCARPSRGNHWGAEPSIVFHRQTQLIGLKTPQGMSSFKVSGYCSHRVTPFSNRCKIGAPNRWFLVRYQNLLFFSRDPVTVFWMFDDFCRAQLLALAMHHRPPWKPRLVEVINFWWHHPGIIPGAPTAFCSTSKRYKSDPCPGQGWCHRPVELSEITGTMTGLVKTMVRVPWSKEIAYGISSSHHH